MRRKIWAWASRRPASLGTGLALVFVAAGTAAGTTGAMLHLNTGNTGAATTTLSGNLGKVFQVTNGRAADAKVPNPVGLGVTSTNGTPLALKGSTAKPPMTVNSAVKVPYLNADKLDNLDSGQLQRRVAGACAAGQAIQVVNANGSVTCEVDDVDGGNAQTLDGKDSTNFYGTGSKVADADKLDGKDSTNFYASGSKVADANKLDGIDSTGFMKGPGEAMAGVLSVPAGSRSFAKIGWTRLGYTCPASPIGHDGTVSFTQEGSNDANVFVDDGGANPTHYVMDATHVWSGAAAAAGDVLEASHSATSTGDAFTIQLEAAAGYDATTGKAVSQMATLHASTVHEASGCHVQVQAVFTR